MPEDQELTEALGEFVETDHYQIAKDSKPIIDRMQSRMPVKISWEGLTYGYLRNGTTRTIANIHYYRSNFNRPIRISLNPVYQDPNLKEDRTQSLTHELAHLGAMRWKGETGHGFYWGYLMIAMGYEPSRCIDTPTSDRLRKAQRAMEKPQTIFEDCPVCEEATFFEMGSDYKYHCKNCNHTL